jgi:hypothetical protein
MLDEALEWLFEKVHGLGFAAAFLASLVARHEGRSMERTHPHSRHLGGDTGCGPRQRSMKTFAMKFIGVSLTILMVIAFSSCHKKPVAVSSKAGKGTVRQIRAIVDASKDGGTWWFPQASPSFDAQKPHQGKAAADAMRAKGWDVVELPRGEVITPERLKGIDIVVRPTPFFPYAESEVTAYRSAVAAGARLLLMGSAGGDAVSQGFGLRFGATSQIASVDKVVPDSVTAGMSALEIPWVPVMDMPKDAVVLAWADSHGPNQKPVLGYANYPEGYILFARTALGIDDQGSALRGKLLTFLEQHSSSDLKQHSPAAPVTMKEAAGPTAPALIAPANGAILDQPSAGTWIFEWRPVPGAQKYQITILGASAAVPLVNTETSSSKLLLPPRQGYIVEPNLRGWTWRVRAQDDKGRWGSWSEARQFDVVPQ